MKKLLLSQFAALLFLAGCSNFDTVVKGNLDNAEGETIILERLSSADATAIDSSEVDKNGDFELGIGEMTDVGFYRLRIGENNYVILLLEQGESVEVSGNASDFFSIYQINGSEGSSELIFLAQVLSGCFA